MRFSCLEVWNPNLHLYAQAGGKLAFSDDTRALVPTVSVPALPIVGAAALIADINIAVEHAAQCGAGNDVCSPTVVPTSAEIGPRVSPAGNQWRQWSTSFMM